jgi:UDP-glucuronate 4-epimerase
MSSLIRTDHVLYSSEDVRDYYGIVVTLEKALSKALGRKVVFGDVPATYASTDRLFQAVGFKPQTSIEEGLQKFADWYVEYYNVK